MDFSIASSLGPLSLLSAAAASVVFVVVVVIFDVTGGDDQTVWRRRVKMPIETVVLFSSIELGPA